LLWRTEYLLFFYFGKHLENKRGIIYQIITDARVLEAIGRTSSVGFTNEFWLQVAEYIKRINEKQWKSASAYVIQDSLEFKLGHDGQ